MNVITFKPGSLYPRRNQNAEIIRPLSSGVLWYRGMKATQACRRWHTEACPGGIDRRISDKGIGK